MAEDCIDGIGNTGKITSCSAEFKEVAGLIILKAVADDGTENKIDADDVIDDAYILAAINNPDPSKRWYPINDINLFESTRAEPVYEELENGTREFLKEGARSATFQIRKVSAAYLGQIKACPCEELAFYLIDINGKIRGKVKTKTGQDLYPIRMQPSTFYAGLVFATATANEYINGQFQFELSEDDALLRVYNSTLVEVDLLTVKGLLDIYPTFSNITTTGFKVKLASVFSDGDKYNASGLVVGDFTLTADGTPVVITSVTETPAKSGTYVFVIPNTLTTKVKVLTPTKNGYDFTPVVNESFTA